jgi:hypothetical protein
MLGEGISPNASTSTISADLVSLDDNEEPHDKLSQTEIDEKVKAVEQRLSKEWKARLDKLDAEWTQRLTKAQEDAVIKVAECKAKSHEAMNQKDSELCSWIAKFHEANRKAEELQLKKVLIVVIN